MTSLLLISGLLSSMERLLCIGKGRQSHHVSNHGCSGWKGIGPRSRDPTNEGHSRIPSSPIVSHSITDEQRVPRRHTMVRKDGLDDLFLQAWRAVDAIEVGGYSAPRATIRWSSSSGVPETI